MLSRHPRRAIFPEIIEIEIARRVWISIREPMYPGRIRDDDELFVRRFGRFVTGDPESGLARDESLCRRSTASTMPTDSAKVSSTSIRGRNSSPAVGGSCLSNSPDDDKLAAAREAIGTRISEGGRADTSRGLFSRSVTIRALLQRRVVGSRFRIPGGGRTGGRDFLRAKISAPDGIKRPFSPHGAYASRHACAHAREDGSAGGLDRGGSIGLDAAAVESSRGFLPPWTVPGDSRYPPA